MIIAVEFKNGRIKEFDSTAFTTSNAMNAGDKTARNVLTELDLRIDLIETEGLRLDFYWYDATPHGKKVEIDGLVDSNGNQVCLDTASRRLGTSVLLCNAEGIKAISRIIVYRANGSVDALWRQGSGDWLINGARFEAQRVISYTDANVTSKNTQVTTVFSYLKAAHPDMSDAAICKMIGYPIEAYQEIMLEETRNAPKEDGEVLGDDVPDVSDGSETEGRKVGEETSSSESPFDADDDVFVPESPVTVDPEMAMPDDDEDDYTGDYDDGLFGMEDI